MYHGIAALLGRSMKLDARQLPPNLFRLGFVLALYGALLIAQLEAGSFGAPGLRFFQNIAWLNFLVILFSGVTYFSTAITEEKEEATLGLLRMAGISPIGILLGKSTSRLISALILLTIQVPFTLLAITLGGATLDQILAAYVALGAFIIFLANAGLFSSVICARGGTAAALTCFWVGLYFIMPWFAFYISSEIRTARGPTTTISNWVVATSDLLQQTSVASELSQIVSSGYGDLSDVLPVDEDGQPISSWSWAVWQIRFKMLATTQVISNIIGGLLFFAISWILFDRLTRYERPGFVAERNLFMPIKIGRAQRSPLGQAWQNPLIWKDFYFVAGGPRWLFSTVADLDCGDCPVFLDVLCRCFRERQLLRTRPVVRYRADDFHSCPDYRSLDLQLSHLPDRTAEPDAFGIAHAPLLRSIPRLFESGGLPAGTGSHVHLDFLCLGGNSRILGVRRSHTRIDI